MVVQLKAGWNPIGSVSFEELQRWDVRIISPIFEGSGVS